MGQYWFAVNLDKKEFVNPHQLGAGLKLWEQLANHPGTGAALVILCAAMPEPRGGGDLDLNENWHGPERTFPKYNISPAPMPDDYQTVARRTIGRWAGDRIALVGDYAEDGDLAPEHKASTLYGRCDYDGDGNGDITDISLDVARVIEHELHGRYEGAGWRKWVEK
jgi:hypothetical protein